jgi:hypothetical protein|tara:strand:+ start:328 stop:573 length:246 start_codon:yes stop_codon:yes gene_type:complete
MTIHKKMFDKKDRSMKDTLHRVYAEWEGGYFVTSLDPEFHNKLQEMVAELGPPKKTEFRAADEGWYKDSSWVDDDNDGGSQ